MQNFLKIYKHYSLKNFENAFQDFFNNNSGIPEIVSSVKFERISKNKILLFRGIANQKFVNDFKSGEMYFATNLANERGGGIYTTPNLLHAQFWTFPASTDWMSVDYGNIDLDNLTWQDAISIAYKYNLFSHGEVLTMCLKENARILENFYLLELKDMIYKMHHAKFKNLAAFVDVQWPAHAVKDLAIYQTKEELLFHNSGLLTRLLDYDILYEDEYRLELNISENEDKREFLIVNPGAIVISK